MSYLRAAWYWLRNLFGDDDDLLDGGCDADINPEPLADEDIPFDVLFGDAVGNPAAVEHRKQEWEELFGDAS